MKKLLYVFAALIFCFAAGSAYAADVKINEFLVHPSSELNEWIEFYNPEHIDLSGYFIDDDTDFSNDSGGSKMKKLEGISSDADYAVFEYSSSMFNNSGDSVVLFSPEGNIVDQYTYSDDPGNDISIGRSPDTTGGFVVLQSPTKGDTNANPKPSPTLSPTKTPTPTKVPTPTKTPTATKTPTQPASKTSSHPTTGIVQAVEETDTRGTVSSSRNANMPEDISLPVLTSSQSPTVAPKTAKVAGVSAVQNGAMLQRTAFWPIIITLIFVIVGGVGGYFVYVKRWHTIIYRYFTRRHAEAGE